MNEGQGTRGDDRLYGIHIYSLKGRTFFCIMVREVHLYDGTDANLKRGWVNEEVGFIECRRFAWNDSRCSVSGFGMEKEINKDF